MANIGRSRRVDRPTRRTDGAWARAIAARLADEWAGRQDFADDALLLERVLARCLVKMPREMRRLIGTGIIEDEYFERD